MPTKLTRTVRWSRTACFKQGAGKAAQRLFLRTSQQRVFVQGDEAVMLMLSLLDETGKPATLQITRASAREIPATRTASLYPEIPGGVQR
jgi:hypothetical protein